MLIDQNVNRLDAILISVDCLYSFKDTNPLNMTSTIWNERMHSLDFGTSVEGEAIMIMWLIYFLMRSDDMKSGICSCFQHIGGGNMVIASFQQTQWMVQPVCSGAIRLKSLGKSLLYTPKFVLYDEKNAGYWLKPGLVMPSAHNPNFCQIQVRENITSSAFFEPTQPDKMHNWAIIHYNVAHFVTNYCSFLQRF